LIGKKNKQNKKQNKTKQKKTKASGIGIKPRGNLQRKYEKTKKRTAKWYRGRQKFKWLSIYH